MELNGESDSNDIIKYECISNVIKLHENPSDNNFSSFLDPEFESQLSFNEKIIINQDVIDEAFPNIAKLNIVQASGDDRSGKMVIIFYACRLPPVSEINLNDLWEYTVKTMKQFVPNDYSLIYFHYGLTNKNNPGVKFLLKIYKQIERDYRKNLKNLFIVHPSAMVNIIINTLLPFLSQNVKRKIIKITRIRDLNTYFYLDQMVIPETIRNHDYRMNSPYYLNRVSTTHGCSQFYSYANSPNLQFGVTLQEIKHSYPHNSIPPVMEQCIHHLRNACLENEGLFRRCSPKPLLEEVQQKYNTGEYVDLEKYDNPHLTACLLKTFFRSLKEPLMTFDLFDDIIKIRDLTMEEAIYHINRIVTQQLPDYNYHVLKYLINFLKEVAQFSEKNKMTLQNLSNVFAPSLCWSRNESSILMIHIIINFTFLLLLNYDIIFVKD